MRTLALCALALAARLAGPQQEPAATLAELSAETDGLRGFRARFRMEVVEEGREPERGELVLTYDAPERAGFTMDAGGKQAGHFILGNAYYAYVAESEGWITFEVEPGAAWDVLEENFPASEPLGRGIVFDLDPREGFQLTVVSSLSGRARLLAWLGRMQGPSAEVTRTPEQWLWSGPSFHFAVAASSGFPAEIRTQSPETRVHAWLEELSVDPGDGPFVELPEAARGARRDEAMEARTARSLCGQLRQIAFARVERRLASGELSWDGGARTRWQAFQAALQGEMLALQFGEWGVAMRARIDDLARELEQRLAQAEGEEARAQLAEDMRAFEQHLRAKLDEGREAFRASLPAVRAAASAWGDELDAEEGAGIAARHEELVAAPLLAHFQQRIAPLLEGR